MGVHHRRTGADRGTKAYQSRSASVRTDTLVEVQSHSPAPRWPLLVVGLGALGSGLWALLLGWLMVRQLMSLTGWLWS